MRWKEYILSIASYSIITIIILAISIISIIVLGVPSVVFCISESDSYSCTETISAESVLFTSLCLTFGAVLSGVVAYIISERVLKGGDEKFAIKLSGGIFLLNSIFAVISIFALISFETPSIILISTILLGLFYSFVSMLSVLGGYCIAPKLLGRIKKK
ncbi:MAG: hypothetical protein WC492_01945 [Candidatus Micrarchaeia archaeon]